MYIHLIANSNFDEASWCMVNLENKETLLLGAVYRSPNSTDMNTRNLLTLLDAFWRYIVIINLLLWILIFQILTGLIGPRHMGLFIENSCF